MAKEDKKTKKHLIAEEVHLDDIEVNENTSKEIKKKKGKDFFDVPEMDEEDPHDWKVPIKKVLSEELEEDSIDHDERELFEQIEEDELLFREKGPRSQ